MIREEPKDFVMKKEGDKTYFNIIKEAYEKVAGKLTEKNNFYLERGPYVIAAVMDESVSDEPLKIEGCYIDLFDPELPVITEKKRQAGRTSLFVRCHEIDRYNPTDGIVRCFTDTGRSLQTGQLSVFSKKSGKYHECVEGVFTLAATRSESDFC